MPSKTEDEDDPVINEWDVFVTAKLAEQLYLLQFPTRGREQPYNNDFRNQPLEMRIKPQTGYLEMDVPVYTQINYDKTKASEFGEALAKSKNSGVKGHGIAAGFAAGSSKHTTGNTEESHLLKHQTLGGQILHDERGKPNYMVGTFLTDKRELHLTALDGVVQMRPQFHHLDARDQVDRAERAKARQTSRAAAGEVLTSKDPQHVQTTYVDGEHSDLVTNRDLLGKAMREHWKRLRFHDEEENDSYRQYNNRLFLDEEQKKLDLLSALDNEAYLDAISVPRLDSRGKLRVKPKKQKVQIDLSDDEATAGEAGAAEQD